MAQFLQLAASQRETRGKRAARRMRRLHNQIPGTVYGAHKEPRAITVPRNTINKALENEAFFSQILHLVIDGQDEQVVLKDLQRHPSREEIMHIDFLRISATEKINMHIPLHFVGDKQNAAVKGGAVISHVRNEVEVRCLPANLPEYIEVDVSALKVGEAIHLSDLKLPEGVELVALSGHSAHDEHDQAIVNVYIPRAETEEAPAAEAAAEGEGETSAGKEGEASGEKGEES